MSSNPLDTLQTTIWQTLLEDFNALYSDQQTPSEVLRNHPILRHPNSTPLTTKTNSSRSTEKLSCTPPP